MTHDDIRISHLTKAKELSDLLRSPCVEPKPDELLCCWIAQAAALAIKRGIAKDQLLSEIGAAFDHGVRADVCP